MIVIKNKHMMIGATDVYFQSANLKKTLHIKQKTEIVSLVLNDTTIVRIQTSVTGGLRWVQSDTSRSLLGLLWPYLGLLWLNSWFLWLYRGLPRLLGPPQIPKQKAS